MQVAGALLDACVLSILTKEDVYGYSLTKQVKDKLDISESSLYPVMRRLQTSEYLTAYDEPFNGRNRRYYKITEKGIEKFKEHTESWQKFKEKINKFMGEENEY